MRSALFWGFLLFLLVLGGSFVFLSPRVVSLTLRGEPSDVRSSATPSSTPVLPPPPMHIETPPVVKGLYMTSWVAGTSPFREKLVQKVLAHGLNAIIVDVKDSTGVVSFRGEHPRVADFDAFIAELHRQGIYVIGRVAVFEDPETVKAHPEWAVFDTRTGKPWKDRNGLSWIDPSLPAAWEQTVALAREAYDRGIDEINFDYIRFPTDGNAAVIGYPHFAGGDKATVIRTFFAYLKEHLTMPLSADIFGQTVVAHDDQGIGQMLEDAYASFGFVAPMIYPSHFSNGSFGYEHPAASPGPIILASMQAAIARREAASSTNAQIRPWLQAFDLGAVYTRDLVRAQMDAVSTSFASSTLREAGWMLWDPSNRYASLP
jgi:hypothetical protein